MKIWRCLAVACLFSWLTAPASAEDQTKIPKATSAMPVPGTKKVSPPRGTAKPALSADECTGLGGTVDRKSNGAGACESGAACVTTDEKGDVHSVCLSKAVAN